MIKYIFNEYDVYIFIFIIKYSHNNGLLSFSQFYSLVTKTWMCWENLFKIRKKLIDKIFIDKTMYYSIFNRKKNIEQIHEYQVLHKGQCRPMPCIVSLKYMIKSIPHPDKFDYDCFNSQILYHNILCLCIKRYIPYYTEHMEPFPGRLLRIFCPYEEFNKVDQYFVFYRNKMYGNRSSIKQSDSHINLLENANNNAENTTESILKPRGRYSQVGNENTLSPSGILQKNFSELHLTVNHSYKYRERAKTQGTSPNFLDNKKGSCKSVDWL